MVMFELKNLKRYDDIFLYQFFENTTNEYPDKIAILFERQTVTYAELDADDETQSCFISVISVIVVDCRYEKDIKDFSNGWEFLRKRDN